MTLNEFLSGAGELLGLAKKSIPNVEAIQKQLDSATAKVAQLEEEKAGLAKKLEDLETGHKAEVERLTTEHQETINGLNAAHEAAIQAKDKEVQGKAAAKALEITQQQGQPAPLPVPPEKANAGKATDESTSYQRVVESFKRTK